MILIRIVILLSLGMILHGGELITPEVIKKADTKYGRFAKNRFADIRDNLLHKIQNKPIEYKLNFVNRRFNKLKYASDKAIYNTNDYWATLYEFVGHNKGDSEDYVIAKYYTLKALGVDPNRMKFLYVILKMKSGQKINHMVLAYLKTPKPKGRKDYLILDNFNFKVLPASKRRNITKVISMFNGDTGIKSKKWKQLELNMKRKKL